MPLAKPASNKKRYSDPTGINLVAETNHTYDGGDPNLLILTYLVI
ncbi:hypothetical protein Syn7502_01042 [Synechococcus sp. PCC 7502]|nr:hypothetical protein Syn7502_01042 [Synechococcus sp. PCC 7502]